MRYQVTQGRPELAVTLEAGEAGDTHALYIAYDTEDRGDVLADWAAFQRGCVLAAEATSATLPVSTFLTAGGYTVCRVFLTTSTLPYDTLLESIHQTGTQYFDTGIYPSSNSVAAIDAKMERNTPRQQRYFAVSSDDETAVFSFDAYINSGGSIATACQSGKGDWWGTSVSPVQRVQIYLSAPENHRFIITADGTELFNDVKNSACTNTSAGTLTVFAHHYFAGGTQRLQNFANGAYLYSFTMTNDGTCVCEYLPCVLGGRAGVYDSVTRAVRFSDSGDDFETGSDPLPATPADGETPLASSSAVDLTAPADPVVGAVWKGTASGNWNTIDANWTIDGAASQPWLDAKDAIFNDNASRFSVSVPNGVTVTPHGITFDNASDYTLDGEGAIAGTGGFAKYGSGKLTITGANHSFTGDILLAGGEIVLPSDKDSSNIKSGSFGNPRVERTITVSNATLRILGKNPFGGGGRSTEPIKTALKFYNSTLELMTNFAFNAGDVYLHNSDVHFHGGLNYSTRGTVSDPTGSAFWGSFSVANLYFSGNRPVIFLSSNGGNKNAGLAISKFARQGVIDVPNMTRDNNVDVQIRMPINWEPGNTSGDWGTASGFRKTGAGTLELTGDDNSTTADSCYTGDVDVVEGTLVFRKGTVALGINRTTALGAVRYPHTFTVHPGATMQFASHDISGQYHNRHNNTIHINGGTLAQNNNVCNGIGGLLILENARLTYGGVLTQGDYFLDCGNGVTNWHRNLTWPTFGFHGGVKFLGTNTYTFGAGVVDNTKYAGFSFGNNDGTSSDCYVAEISGNGTPDDNPDVTFNVKLVDAPPWYGYANTDAGKKITGTNQVGHVLNMRKTGPGMLQLGSKLSTTLGRIEVKEGTLKMGTNMGSGEQNFECPTNTLLGDLRDPSRVALVLNGGTLWLTGNDTFGQANTVNSSIFAVTNGTIRQTKEKVNALPVLDLYDATLDYSSHNSGYGGDIAAAHPWGTFIFSQRVRFDGTRPYDLQNIGGTCYFSLGWQSDSYQVANGNYTEQHGKTEFYVADITTNANPDVTIGVVLKIPDRWNGNDTNHKYRYTNFRTGLLKTGPGTLRLNCANDEGKYYTEATRVNDGALLVDSTVFRSTNIFVQAGAYLGGTGTVARVTVEAGGGFTAAPGQTGALTVSAVQLSAGGEVALDIPYIGEEEAMAGYRIPVVKSAGLEGARWNVTVNGEPAPNGYAANAIVQNGVVYGVISRSGTIFMIR